MTGCTDLRADGEDERESENEVKPVKPIRSGESAYAPSRTVSEGTPCERFDPWVEINTRRLRWNLAQVRGMVGDMPIMAVVKCNAYGHGTVGVAKTLQDEGIEHFATVKVQEAIALREHGIRGTILNFGPCSPADAEEILEYDITQSVFSNTVEGLARTAQQMGKTAKVHVKVDTGLSRVGVPHGHAQAYLKKLAALPGIAVEGIFTTLTKHDDFDLVQLERFNQVCESAAAEGISVGARHVASTNELLIPQAMAFDMVRPGSCLYGMAPHPTMELKPIMELKTRVILVKTVGPGDSIFYGRHHMVDKERRLATLPLGYADGYPFQSVDKAEALIRGRRWPLIVYMSGNHAIVDITGSEDIDVGDEVVLIGAQGEERIMLEDVAAWVQSSVYKVATSLSPFVPRVFLE